MVLRYTLMLFFVVLLFTSCKKNVSPIIISTNDSFDVFADTTLPTSTEALSGKVYSKQAANPLFVKRTWQGIPSIGIDRDDNIFVTWYTGGTGEGLLNYVTVAMSNDKGKSWKQNELMIKATPDSVRFFDAAFWNDKYNNLYLSWSKDIYIQNNWKTLNSLWYTKITYKNDTVKYSEPKRMGNGVMLNKPININNGNAMLFPIANWYRTDSNVQKPFFYLANYSTNSLTKATTLSAFPLQTSLRSYDEHMVAQLNDTSYLAMIRGIDGIYYSRSKNAIQWDAAQKFTTVGATCSGRFFIGKLKSGRLALVINNSSQRENLRIFLSEDGGKTWPYNMLIDYQLNTSYPDLVQDSNGKIYMVYDYDRLGKGAINMVTFAEDDIVKNNPNNITRILVSSIK